MISRCINQVRLASDVADEFIPNIRGDNYREDVSWLATMRALLPSRIPTGQKVRLDVVTKKLPSRGSKEERTAYLINGVDCTTPYTITVVNVEANSGEMDKLSIAIRHVGIADHAFMEAIYQRYHDGKEHPGYILVYINDETANTVIITSSLNMMMWHSLQGFMRKYFKKAFDEHPATEDEMNLLRALVSPKGYDSYMELISKFEEPYDFRSAIIRKSLANFAAGAKRRSIQEMENTIRDADKIIRDAQRRIAAQIARREDANTKLYGLKFSLEEDKTAEELTDYFLHNKQLIFENQQDGRIDYWVKGELCYFDEQAAESYIRTTSGYMYSGCTEYGIEVDDFQKVLRAIFLDHTVKVEMCASYRFIFSSDEINIVINQSDDVPVELQHCLKNPHSMYNNCWGTHSVNLAEALSTCDYTGAVAVTIAATCELNVTDISTATFSKWLCSSEQKCLRLPDGRHMTCKEYIEMMREEG